MGVPLSAVAQEAFYTTGTYTIDAAHSVSNDAFIGEDSTFSKTDSMGNPYSPTVNLVTGGSVGDYLYALNSSQVAISGGSIEGFLDAYDSSQVMVSGGSVGYAAAAIDSSRVTISGGSVGSYLFADNSSQVTVSGGTFSQYVGVNFYDGTTGSFTLVGSNLMATNAGSDSYFGGTDYDLSGTLLDGTNLNGYVLNVQAGSTFTLQNAPPSAVPVSGAQTTLIGLLGLSGFACLRNRRKQAVP
jgi:hypothetical protein